MLVTARPLKPAQLATAVALFKKATKGGAPQSCPYTDKHACPLLGLGDAAYFLSVYVGGGGSGLLVMDTAHTEFLINSALNLTNDPAKLADNSGPPYYANQASLIALAKSVAAKLGSTKASPPGVPTDLQATPGYGEVQLSWSPPSNDGGSGIMGYLVLYRTGASGAVTTQKLGSIALTATVTGLSNGDAYQFAVEAVNISATGPATAYVPGTPTATAPPLAPGNFTATVTVAPLVQRSAMVQLFWSPPRTTCTTAKCKLVSYTLTYDAPYVTTDVHGHTSTTLKQLTKQLGGGSRSDVITPLPLDLSADPFSLVAKNGYGVGASADVTVLLEVAPKRPLVTAVPGIGAVTLSWLDNPQYDQVEGVGPLTGEAVYEGTAAGKEASKPVPASQMAVATSSSTQGHVTTTTVSVTVNGLAANTTYYLKATALDAAGASRRSLEVSATPLGPPGPPVGVSATRGNREVLLSWQPPASDGGAPVTGYNVYQGTSPGGEGATSVATTTGTAVFVTNDAAPVRNGTKYYFTVKAVNTVGLGAASAEVSATPEPVPGSPNSLTATAGGGSVKLTWAAPPGAVTGYDLYQGTGPGAEGATSAHLPASPASDTVSGLTPGTTYYFTVAGVNASGEGLVSNEAFAVPTVVLTPPGPPVGVNATRGNREVLLTWHTPVSDGGTAITGYNVYQGTSPGGEGATSVATTTGTAVFATNDAAQVRNGTKYYFTVKAVNTVGLSTASAEVSATPEPVPGAPLGLSAATAGSGRVKLTWAAPSGASGITGYDLYDGTAPGAEGPTPKQLPVTPGGYTISGLTAGTTYYFTVAAVNASGAGLPSAEASALAQGAPGEPLQLTVSSGNEQVALRWVKPINDGGSPVTGYTVLWYEANSTTTSSAVLGSAVPTSDTVSGLTNGTTYVFDVEASNASGTGAASTGVSATPTTSAPPLAPRNLTATVKANGGHYSSGTGRSGATGSVTLHWSKPYTGGCQEARCRVSGYSLSYDEDKTTTAANGSLRTSQYMVSQSLSASASSATVNLPLNFKTDTFSLSAKNDFGQGPAAEDPVLLETVPLGLLVTAVPGPKEVTLSWVYNKSMADSSGVGSIIKTSVYEGTSAGGEAATPLPSSQLTVQTSGTDDLTLVTTTVTGLTDGTRYYFTASNTDAAGEGPKSKEVSAIPVG